TCSIFPTEMYGRSLVSASIDSAGLSPRSFQGPLDERRFASVCISSSVGALKRTNPVKSFVTSRLGGTLATAPDSTCLLVVKATPPHRCGPRPDPNHRSEQFAPLF